MDNQLSKAQRQIVEHPSNRGNMLVLAGAGSGKTRVITSRVEWLLARRLVEPEHVVVMTFTDKAATELEHRLEDQLSNDVQGVRIGTIHHICNCLLGQYGADIGLKPGYNVLDAQRQDAALRLVAMSIGHSLMTRQDINKARAAISRHRQQEALALSRDLDQPVFTDGAFALLNAAYRAYLQEHAALDFDDLIFHALRLFDMRINPNLTEQIHGEIRYIFIDEFHDLSPEQFRLLELLAPKRRDDHQVLVVADPNQAIYGWRDADAHRTLTDYRRLYRPEEFRLYHNHRSAGNLVTTGLSLEYEFGH